jgi:hypothetical protein
MKCPVAGKTNEEDNLVVILGGNMLSNVMLSDVKPFFTIKSIMKNVITLSLVVLSSYIKYR